MNDEKQTTILIVEDNPLTLRVLLEHLKKLGINTPVARSGEEAIRQVALNTPELILLDIMLPGIDGFETCRRIKSHDVAKDVPVIFITALSETADKVKAFEAGGTDYITKPYHYAEVVARVNTHLTLQTLHRQLQKQKKE